MKKKKWLIYLCCMAIPVIIFFIASTLIGYLPIGDELLNAYDSFTQYPGMLLEYIRLLKIGNIFYSFKAGLGFNFFGTLTYYCMSPLNLLAFFANSSNYPIFIMIMTYIRFALLGGSMSFYLQNKGVKPVYVILFSTIYALMGYTATYYYNYLWIDSIIMLPLVIHGLDKLLDSKSPLFYIVSLSITIFINYYIGYMICIFVLLYFIYKIVLIKENRRKLIKTFIISSLLSGIMNAIVIIPSMFSLLSGKASLYKSTNYLGFTKSLTTFFYTLTTGTYRINDQIDGPALVFVTILSVVATIFYFFNKHFSKREKIATAIMILILYLSISINFLNYSWQFFQKPIWWQSRFSFVFSFFLIDIAVSSLMNIKDLKMDNKSRIITCIIFSILALIGAFFKWKDTINFSFDIYIFLGFSIMVFIEEIFLVDKKSFFKMIFIFTIIEPSLNTYVSLKANYRYQQIDYYKYKKDEIPKYIEELNEKETDFYRMELSDKYTSLDGLYFGFNGLNYFNSARNQQALKFLSNIGVTVIDDCVVELDKFDPVIMSLLNIKYIYGNDINYLKEIDTRLYENPYPLSLGFAVKRDVKDLVLTEDENENKENILKAMTGIDKKLYKTIKYEDFDVKSSNELTYTFTSDGHYFVIPNQSGFIVINGNKSYFNGSLVEIEKNDVVSVQYNTSLETKDEEVFLSLLNISSYEAYMDSLSRYPLHAKANNDNHILEAHIKASKDYDYLYTSIVYEEGMKVFVDGREVTPDIILGALIGLQLDENEHDIVIDYVPKCFKIGSITSIIGLLATTIYLQFQKKEI